MTLTEIISRMEHSIRPLAMKLPPHLISNIYSRGRKTFLNILEKETLIKPVILPPEQKRKLWDIDFNCNLFNAAGMFKTGGGYILCASQGAGAYLSGTTTKRERQGNTKNKIVHPFMPLPKTHSAINWMGLPNEGHAATAKKLSQIEKIKGCPLGASLAASPEDDENDALVGLLEGLRLYEKAGVDFIELNESCPNVPHIADKADESLYRRLEYICTQFIKKRNRNMPVIVKFSVDTDSITLPKILDILIDLGYDGINLGNTSTDYNILITLINPAERKHFEYFTEEYGGGLSGAPLKEKSLSISRQAVDYISNKRLGRDFHVIRTGGIESSDDLRQSNEAEVSLNQWFTGYFEGFARLGHRVYEGMNEKK